MMLGFRLGRRQIAVVSLSDEQIAFYESRFVASNRNALERTMRAYFAKILDQLAPARICYYAPTTANTAADQLAGLLKEQADARRIPISRIEKAALLDSCGLPLGAKRLAVKDYLRDIWPVLSEGRADRQLVCAEALVSALIGDSEL